MREAGLTIGQRAVRPVADYGMFREKEEGKGGSMVEVISLYVGGSANELLQLISFLARRQTQFPASRPQFVLASAQSSPWSLLAF